MSNWSDSNDYLFSSSLASYLDTNIVLEGTKERVIVGNLYCDISLGLYIVRGENVMLIGQRESDEEELPPHMTCVSEIEIQRVQKADKNAEELKGSTRRRMEFIDFD
ncbi:sm-like protein LSM1B isoform X2 [Solanum lycopersicum]|uniref:sm-like protein LSM1B isoform X2 n=1 Tax=Solanum lycopersicum TaxID=4081 RepID=UPI000532DED8|nr:sm-like protein LSM1B isoform X2 [Solanum lycopersicum]